MDAVDDDERDDSSVDGGREAEDTDDRRACGGSGSGCCVCCRGSHDVNHDASSESSDARSSCDPGESDVLLHISIAEASDSDEA
eukprot:CAMPEP_0118870062 /NCGR_PEP_ID=MMETSP1163-20130328/13170_1 /TAXON_ID=124430 /ORGANISM="Phaeomonas parva, Strain CCMP2877" /LENGTH=83 /DNA_ID=CAMNT_0006805005 /DNA_START=40 /DNA_END=288 /DNA_ORIENTATION=+